MSASATYPIAVPDIGDFTFRRRNMRDQIRIEAEAVRILAGPTDDKDLHQIALAVATIQVLKVTTPDGWDPEALDPLDADSSRKIWQVYGSLRRAEDDFRKGA